ncbi:Peptidase family M48 [Teratosphaeria destructans]|uniref:Peptidase family M48 n=1 Tax=Teratosphaeria destructans TaxID=418781 RepID=A0A9W7SR00_9PEZI|nr:Peptidase family M48 [Teratosphaeria destructans]
MFLRRMFRAQTSLQQTYHRTFQTSARQQALYRRQAFNYQRFQSSRNLYRRWRARPTFAYEVGGLVVITGGFYIYNQEQVPVSNRYRFNVVRPAYEAQLGQQQYEQTMQEFGRKVLPAYSPEHRMVQRVLNRLIPNCGLPPDYQWEAHVIDDDMKNAFVIPGGKVFVFRGILDVAEGEDGLAAVLGHEIAHNVAHHAAERMSQGFVFLGLGYLVSQFIGIDFGISNFVMQLAFTLPGSRAQESEADYIGLLMMAQSCYDPRAAMRLWSRMEQFEKGQGAPPQFMSTHPSSHNRLEKIAKWLPEADNKLESSDCGFTTRFADDFRRRMPDFGL